MNLAMDLIREALLGGSGGGGGGGGDGTMVLLKEQDLGKVSTTSTSAVNIGTVYVKDVLGLYDAVLYEVNAAEEKVGYHWSTRGIFWKIKSGASPSLQNVTHKSNIFVNSDGTKKYISGSTAYGIYPDGTPAASGSDITMTLYGKYSSTYTGTIDGNYTIRVYGLNFPS